MVTTNPKDFKEKYNDLSHQKESPATPIKINIGTNIGQIASCNLSIVPDDSTEGLLDMLGRISISSSKAEGIGLAVSNIRSKESNVGKSDGKAGGVLKYLKVVNESLRFWNQRGKRPGSCAVYIEPWHKDVFDVLEIRKKTGDETLRARDLFSALWIPDNFMRAVQESGDWYLFCPHDIKTAGLKPFYEIYGQEFEEEYNKAIELGIGTKIKAHDLWIKILESQIETGMPYMCYKDHANEKSNQKNFGVIHSSNLCVDGETLLKVKIDGDDKEISIEKLVDIWHNDEGVDIEVLSFNIDTNKKEYKSITNAALMNGSAEVLKITDEETGKSIVCTEDHKIYTKNRGYVLAKDLKIDDILEII
jgi:ribonucleotide reductase alpha subunit